MRPLGQPHLLSRCQSPPSAFCPQRPRTCCSLWREPLPSDLPLGHGHCLPDSHPTVSSLCVPSWPGPEAGPPRGLRHLPGAQHRAWPVAGSRWWLTGVCCDSLVGPRSRLVGHSQLGKEGGEEWELEEGEEGTREKNDRTTDRATTGSQSAQGRLVDPCLPVCECGCGCVRVCVGSGHEQSSLGHCRFQDPAQPQVRGHQVPTGDDIAFTHSLACS